MEAAIGHNSQSKNTDWIAVYRNLRVHPIVGFLNADGTRRRGAKVCQSMAWVDLCMEANWKDRQENNNGQMVLVERGQLQGGRKWLAERWGWTEEQVRWFLKKLSDEGMVTVDRPKITRKSHSTHTGSTTKSTPKSTRFVNIISISNYNIYQAACELDELLNPQIDNHPNPQTTPKQPPHSNKETNKQDKNNPPPQPVPGPAQRGGGLKEVEGLNGATALIVEKLAGWIKPGNPDYETAMGFIERTVSFYGGEALKAAFCEFEAKREAGEIVARPVQYLSNAVIRHGAKIKEARDKTGKYGHGQARQPMKVENLPTQKFLPRNEADR